MGLCSEDPLLIGPRLSAQTRVARLAKPISRVRCRSQFFRIWERAFGAERSGRLTLVGKNTSWGKRVDLTAEVSLYELPAKKMSPVIVVEENKLHWIWLHVDGIVAEVGNRMDAGLEEDDDAGDLVDVDVVLQWKNS